MLRYNLIERIIRSTAAARYARSALIQRGKDTKSRAMNVLCVLQIEINSKRKRRSRRRRGLNGGNIGFCCSRQVSFLMTTAMALALALAPALAVAVAMMAFRGCFGRPRLWPGM